MECGEVVPRLGRGWRQGSTAGQFDRPGYVTEGYEPADWSRGDAHRLKITVKLPDPHHRGLSSIFGDAGRRV